MQASVVDVVSCIDSHLNLDPPETCKIVRLRVSIAPACMLWCQASIGEALTAAPTSACIHVASHA